MGRPRLTPHQAEVYARIWRLCGSGRIIPAQYVGARGALQHLERKGYVVLTTRVGPRGGEHLYVSLP